jgi:hypothetical protein
MACYFRKPDTIAVGLSFLLKIVKYRLHNLDGSSVGVALRASFANHTKVGYTHTPHQVWSAAVFQQANYSPQRIEIFHTRGYEIVATKKNCQLFNFWQKNIFTTFFRKIQSYTYNILQYVTTYHHNLS